MNKSQGSSKGEDDGIELHFWRWRWFCFVGMLFGWGDHEGGGEGGGIYTNTGEKTPAGEGGYTNLIRDRVVPET